VNTEASFETDHLIAARSTWHTNRTSESSRCSKKQKTSDQTTLDGQVLFPRRSTGEQKTTKLHNVCVVPNLGDELREGVKREAEDVEERNGAEGLGGGKLVSQPGVHAEGHHRHENRDHVEQEHVDLQE
jgi:hypothetical protein